MKPPAFEYARPESLEEALSLLADNPDAKVLAGGQSLIPLLSMRLVAPRLVVDVNRVAELAYVRAEDDGVRVGALARHAEVAADEGAARVQPLVGKALRLVAHPTIRNRGTTVGSIVHADAAAEMPAVLTLLGGHLTVASQDGTRAIPVDELFVGPMECTIQRGELAVEAFFPALRPGQGVAVDEVSRRHGDYALCGVAVLVDLGASEGAPLALVKAAYLSVCDVPTVVDLTDVYADGISDDGHEAAGELALTRLEPQDDIHATSDYRSQLIRTLTRRVVEAAVADARERAMAGSAR
ncbi:MAG: FAD binding domain-containing protein [Nocardioidaceae bacterium]